MTTPTPQEIAARAVKDGLFIAHGKSPLGGPRWCRVKRIEGGSVIVRNEGDGLVRDMPLSLEDFVSAAGEDGRYLMRQVGFWDFACADDPAADCIRYCHQSPQAAGRELYELRKKLKETQ